MFVTITVSLRETSCLKIACWKSSAARSWNSCVLFSLTWRKDSQCLGIGVSSATFIRLPKLLVELLILGSKWISKTIWTRFRVLWLYLLNKYAVNSFLQYCPKLTEPFGTTACFTAAPSNTYAVKSGLTQGFQISWSYLTYQLNAFYHKLTMVTMRISMVFMGKEFF